MPQNNGRVRRENRKLGAKARTLAAEQSGQSVAEREAERGYPAKLNAQKG